MYFDKSSNQFYRGWYEDPQTHEDVFLGLIPNGGTVGVWEECYKFIPPDITEPRIDCFLITTTLKNVFVKSDNSETHGERLIAGANGVITPNDCNNPITSGTQIQDWYWTSQHEIQPELHKYNTMEVGKNHRFHNWLDLAENPHINHTHQVNNIEDVYTKFLISKSATLQCSFESMSTTIPVRIRDPWRVTYNSCIASSDFEFRDYNIGIQGLDLGDFNGFGGVHKD